MLNKLFYTVVLALTVVGTTIIVFHREALKLDTNIWEFINALLLLITGLIVLLYTNETYLLRKHTANQNRPLISWIPKILNKGEKCVVTEHYGYHENKKPILYIDIKNFGEEKALIKKIEARNYYISIFNKTELKAVDYPSIMEKDDEDVIELEYQGIYETFANKKEYMKKYPAKSASGISILYGIEPREFEISNQLIAAPEKLSFRLVIWYQNLAGTEYKRTIRVKNREIM